MGTCWWSISWLLVTIQFVYGLPEPAARMMDDRLGQNSISMMEDDHPIQNLMYTDEMSMGGSSSYQMNVDGMGMADDHNSIVQEDESSESDLQVNIEIARTSQFSRCVKKNLKKYVTEYDDMMQCTVQYEEECHQIPKQVCNNVKINPKKVEKSYVQTICYNDNVGDGDGVVIKNKAGKHISLPFIFGPSY